MKTTNKMKRQPTEQGKIFANDVTNKGLILKIYKKLTHLNIKTLATIQKARQKIYTDISPEKTFRCQEA